MNNMKNPWHSRKASQFVQRSINFSLGVVAAKRAK